MVVLELEKPMFVATILEGEEGSRGDTENNTLLVLLANSSLVKIDAFLTLLSSIGDEFIDEIEEPT